MLANAFSIVSLLFMLDPLLEEDVRLEEDNRIELSPFHQQWDGFQVRVRAMQPIFHNSIFITI